jgi:hypothetical protein
MPRTPLIAGAGGLLESEQCEQVASHRQPREIVMPPARKAAPTAKKTAAPVKAAPAKAAAQATVTLKHLAAALADSHDIAKKQAEASAGRLGGVGHAASQEGRQNPPDRPWHPPGAEAGGPDGTEPRDR